MRDAGADQLVVAMKPGNAGGAKGLNRPAESEGQPKREEPRTKAKPYCISKQSVWEAYKRVKRNRGSAGVDGASLEAFETDLKRNLYKVWNRMSSGSYFPPPVRLVEIPKRDGGRRPLGIPTVSDRIAQTVAKMCLEPLVEPKFHPDSYALSVLAEILTDGKATPLYKVLVEEQKLAPQVVAYDNPQTQNFVLALSADRTKISYYQRHFCLKHGVKVNRNHLKFCS